MKPIILFIVLGFSVVIHAQKKFEYGFKGQLSDAIGLHPEKPFVFQNTARFIPELSLGYAFTEKFKIDTEISLNAYYTAENANKTWTDTAALPLYRAWLRLTGKQYEFRVGLQKINFGQAVCMEHLFAIISKITQLFGFGPWQGTKKQKDSNFRLLPKNTRKPVRAFNTRFLKAKWR